jgi:tryptophan halogenase
MKDTGSTIKYGIHHKDWHTIGKNYLAPLAGSPTSGSAIDHVFCHQALSRPNQMHLLNITGIYAEKMISPFDVQTLKFDNIGHALHFDAHAVGKYFKKVVLKNPKVQWIDDEIVDVSLNETGDIDSLILKRSLPIYGDFFVDASGFSRVLMKRLDNPWISYSENLPVNSAMPFLLDYETDEIPEPWTTAWAQSSGWMWQIPTADRKGCGYVFDDNFITPDQAQAEIEQTIGKKIQPIRVLKFDTGRLKNSWVKNCLAVGLCSAFAEPLEATSIHSTIIHLLNFVFENLKDTKERTCNTGSINIYNKRTSRMYDDFKDFLNIHYMGGREDSNFWKYIKTGKTQTDNTRDILEIIKYKLPSNKDFNQYIGGTDWGLYSYVLFGINRISPDVLRSELDWVKKSVNENYPKEILVEYQNDIFDRCTGKMNYKNFINLIRKK